MNTPLTVLGAVVLFATGTALGDLCSKEIRGRLDQIPYGLLNLVARRMPESVRADLLEEWEGELHQFLHGAEALPVTRLWRGLRYSASLLHAAPKIIEAAGLSAPTPAKRQSSKRRPSVVAKFFQAIDPVTEAFDAVLAKTEAVAAARPDAAAAAAAAFGAAFGAVPFMLVFVFPGVLAELVPSAILPNTVSSLVIGGAGGFTFLACLAPVVLRIVVRLGSRSDR